MGNPENRQVDPVNVPPFNPDTDDIDRGENNDANNKAREAKETQRLIFAIEDRIKTNGFDCRFAGKDNGKISYQMVERGVPQYTVTMDVANQEFTLSRNYGDGGIVDKSSDLNGIDFPNPASSAHYLLEAIKRGEMDQNFGNTKFSLKAERVGNLYVWNFSKVGMFSDEPAFSLTYNQRTGEYVLSLTVVKKSGNKTSITPKELGRGLNGYTLINRNSTKILPHLNDGRLNEGNACHGTPRIYPPEGMFAKDRKNK